MDKLKSVIEERYGGSQTRFARAAGLSQGHVSNLLSGRRHASGRDVVKIYLATAGQVRDVDLFPELTAVGVGVE